MKDLDELIDRFVGEPQRNDPIIVYRCFQHQYDVYYAPSLGEATYKFWNGNEIDVDHLTFEQVAYYVTSDYWKKEN